MRENSMKQRLLAGEITQRDYRNYTMQKKLNGEKTMHRRCLNGEISKKEYDNYKAQKSGFKDRNERRRHYRHEKHICSPQSENSKCATYLGVHIAEYVLSRIFENVQRMPQNFPGYDFICGRGYKIEVKSACVRKNRNSWFFNIRRNKIADYFLLLAFDNRDNLNPKYIWLVKGNEIIYGKFGKLRKQLNDKQSLIIFNTDIGLMALEQYKQSEKLEKVTLCCNKWKEAVGDDKS